MGILSKVGHLGTYLYSSHCDKVMFDSVFRMTFCEDIDIYGNA